jgi:hypothetical protein
MIQEGKYLLAFVPMIVKPYIILKSSGDMERDAKRLLNYINRNLDIYEDRILAMFQDQKKGFTREEISLIGGKRGEDDWKKRAIGFFNVDLKKTDKGFEGIITKDDIYLFSVEGTDADFVLLEED